MNTFGVEMLISDGALIYNIFVVLMVDTLSVLAVTDFPDILSVDKPPVVAVIVVIV
jgi:hypothetical protein